MQTGLTGRMLLGALLLMVAGCNDLPRDPAGTTERVKRSGSILVGMVAGDDYQVADAILQRVASRNEADVRVYAGSAEELLTALEKGRLDLVYGEFAKSSPWSRRVHLSPPLGRRKIVGTDENVPRFAFRNGENGWIMLVQEEIR